MILKYVVFRESKCPRARACNFTQPLRQVGHLSKTFHPIYMGPITYRFHYTSDCSITAIS